MPKDKGIICEAELDKVEKKKLVSLDYRVRATFDICGREKELMRVLKWLADIEADKTVVMRIEKR